MGCHGHGFFLPVVAEPLLLSTRFLPFGPKGRLRDILCGYDAERSNRNYIPVYDIMLGFVAAMSSLFIVL